MKKLIISMLLAAGLSATAAAAAVPPEVTAPSAILIERETGQVLFEKNSHQKLSPASVTKIMTMLLTMEALENGTVKMDDLLTCSDYAASMGGSQIFLEPGEQMTLHDLLKSIAVSSANDACVVVAEHLAGSEGSFVSMMNSRAAELGMADTHFENCTGLDAAGHVSSASDIAVMSRELLRHSQIREFTTIWMDTVRNGAFGLANTNKLIRFYNGATGLKTGFTASAGYCLSASALRDGMELIAVVMKCGDSKNRFADASNLLNYGYANYALVRPETQAAGLGPVPVVLGKQPQVAGQLGEGSAILVEKAKRSKVEQRLLLSDSVEAPVQQGQRIGSYLITLNGEQLAEFPVVASEAVERQTVGDIYGGLLGGLFMHGGTV